MPRVALKSINVKFKSCHYKYHGTEDKHTIIALKRARQNWIQ